MLRSFALITFIIITLTFNPYLIPQVYSSVESSFVPLDDNTGDDNESNGSGSQDESPWGDSEGTDSTSDGSVTDENRNDNGFKETNELELRGNDDDEVDEEPPTSEERAGGNPLEGLNLPSPWTKERCEEYLKSLGGGDDTNIGDTIENPFETPEERCKRIQGGEGIVISNTTMTATSELMNQTGLINDNNATEGGGENATTNATGAAGGNQSDQTEVMLHLEEVHIALQNNDIQDATIHLDLAMNLLAGDIADPSGDLVIKEEGTKSGGGSSPGTGGGGNGGGNGGPHPRCLLNPMGCVGAPDPDPHRCYLPAGCG